MTLCHRKSQRLRVGQLPLVRTDVPSPDHQSTYRYEDNIATPSHYWDNAHATTLKAAILPFMLSFLTMIQAFRPLVNATTKRRSSSLILLADCVRTAAIYSYCQGTPIKHRTIPQSHGPAIII